jgi:ribosomal protein S12 methylthiotransferase accessory factor YcaO
MFGDMTRPLRAPERHKAVPPLETVRRIRALLADLDVFTVETFHPPAENGAAYSCRLELGDAPFLGAGFSVNGKGMSPRWALASAYGEFMERLECGELLPGLPEGFSEPDAVDMPAERFARECPEAFLRAMGVEDRGELANSLGRLWRRAHYVVCRLRTLRPVRQCCFRRGCCGTLRHHRPFRRQHAGRGNAAGPDGDL